ncbi:ester cyclase [Actinoplanes sp. LDG1-01]|uniref:Ester cyclase n=1 Tax=Paractinoplanes lichenicola TaxID=2802976 RepID=A0ABS1VMY3_9ACTN|nr:ester cyclase [Actinoplanes lichenicola]
MPTSVGGPGPGRQSEVLSAYRRPPGADFSSWTPSSSPSSSASGVRPSARPTSAWPQPDDYHGLDAYKAFSAAAGADAFTGMHLEVLRLLAQDDLVYALFTNSGTNVGDFMGSPATGKYGTARCCSASATAASPRPPSSKTSSTCSPSSASSPSRPDP